ncbi:MAG TPA: LON peptidase substrate-binding domain-containing protein [Candidatus Binataceae bacterium]|nr:LON peptidase substrate-binding domain-containing protein [Candidatus Binataceae bacterium]
MAVLPDIVPLFPLPNLVLFPGVEVPLHIFEPRYREMVADVREGHGIIGMTLLKGDWEQDYYGSPELFGVGCAGKIERLVSLPDGRYNLLLTGLSEFRIIREHSDRLYRQAEVRPCAPEPSALELDDEAMVYLRDLLTAYLGRSAWEAWRELVDQRGFRDAALVNFLCFHLDFSTLEKQTLLEARDERFGCLLDILTFKIEERKLGPGGDSGGSGVVQ